MEESEKLGCGCLVVVIVGVLFSLIGNSISQNPSETDTIVTTESYPPIPKQPTLPPNKTINSSSSDFTPTYNNVSTSREEETPDDAYNDGYEAGYEQGLEDGLNGHGHSYGYDDASDYSKIYETKYREGYENGYDDGFDEGNSRYERENDDDAD